MNQSSSNPADSWFGRPPPDFARLPPRPEPAAQMSDIIINECLTLEAEGEVHEAAARLRRAAIADPGIIERFNATRRVLSILETEVPVGPDLSARIIAGVDERRPFLPRRTPRRLSTSRLIVAPAVLAALAVAAVVQWQPPPSPSPASPVTASADGGEALRADPISPLRALGEASADAARPRLSFGNADAYGQGNWVPSLTIPSEGAIPAAAGRSEARAARTASPGPTLLSPAPNASVLRVFPWDVRADGPGSLIFFRDLDPRSAGRAMPPTIPAKPTEKPTDGD